MPRIVSVLLLRKSYGHSGKSRTWVLLKKKSIVNRHSWWKGSAVAALGEALVMQTDTVMLETDRGGLYSNGTSFQGRMPHQTLGSIQPPPVLILTSGSCAPFANTQHTTKQPWATRCNYNKFVSMPLDAVKKTFLPEFTASSTNARSLSHILRRLPKSTGDTSRDLTLRWTRSSSLPSVGRALLS